MLYVLNQEELDNLVPQTKLYDEKKKVEMLLESFKKHWGCRKNSSGYCDNCPISSLNNQYGREICQNERYSK